MRKHHSDDKISVYIETSVISYLTSRPSRDLIVAARQQITKEWWDFGLEKISPFLSSFVIDEIQLGDKDAASKRLELVKGIPVIDGTNDMKTLAAEYAKRLNLSKNSIYDCYHMACAVMSKLDIIVSWNFKHIANPFTRKFIHEINRSYGFQHTDIVTPEEFLGGIQ